MQPNLCHVRFLVGYMFSNGATISDLWCRDETESLLWARTQGCAARHALVSRFLVMIHCRTAPICYSHLSSSLVISPYHVKRYIYVELDAIGLPCEVVQWLTFEEQVTNRNINRLQEVVDK